MEILLDPKNAQQESVNDDAKSAEGQATEETKAEAIEETGGEEGKGALVD